MDKRSEDIYKDIGDKVLAEAANRYSVAPDKLTKLGSFESFVYEFERDSQNYILKITHSIHRTPDLVRGELEWVNYLAENCMNVCAVIQSANNKLIEIIDGKSVAALEDDYFIIYAFEKAPGRLIQKSDWNDRLFEKWGQTLGRMHALSKKYVPSDPAIKRFEWHEDESLKVEKHIPPSQGLVIDRINNLQNHLKGLPTNNDNYGLVHSDLHHSNFFLSDGRMTLFDFDDCHYNWYAFDIMIPLFYLLRDAEVDPNDTSFARHFMDRFMSGYSLENSIDKSSMARIPECMKLREMDLYIIIHAEDAADLDGWCRRFMQDRRQRIENDIPVIDLDFSQWGS
jgi:Ser/Thr protein kinase RdoA (MazF antagonist)